MVVEVKSRRFVNLVTTRVWVKHFTILFSDGSFFTLAMTTTTTTTLPSTQTTKNSAAATLSIMSACQTDIECPGHASCNVRYPSGQVCYCDENYLASTNLAVCEPGKQENGIVL